MRLPRMTIRRGVIVIALAAIDFTLIFKGVSRPLALIAFFGTLFVIILLPVMLLLFTLAADD
jgi:hypothetical protein